MERRNRRLVIGDIHGSLLALIQLLDRMNYNAKYDLLIFLGDYVDGWSDSAFVIDWLIDQRRMIRECEYDVLFEPIHLRGNHDEWLLKWLEFGYISDGWLDNGGQSTLKSYTDAWNNDALNNTKEDHIKFLKYLHNYWITNDNKGFVHGGYMTSDGLMSGQVNVNIWDRSIAKIIARGEMHSMLKAHHELYIGHTSTLAWGIDIPMDVLGRYWNIDTGGGWFGKLTGMDVDTKEYWQTDLVSSLHPESEGRGVFKK